MKFNVSSSKLFAQLQAVSRVINNKNSLPILDDVLFDLSGNALTLTASDGETTIRTSVEVENAEGAGKVASAAKLLLETLKEHLQSLSDAEFLALTCDLTQLHDGLIRQVYNQACHRNFRAPIRVSADIFVCTKRNISKYLNRT